MIVTIYGGADRPQPVNVADLDWDTLADELASRANTVTRAPPTASPEEQKKALAAFAPHRLRAPYRKLENVEAVTLAVIDVDNDPPAELADTYTIATPEAVAERLERARVAALLYESPTSTDDHPKFRIVCPVSRELAPDECRHVRIALSEALGLEPGCGVEGAIDAAKLFFVGRLHGTRERRTWRVDGAALNVDALPAPTLAWGRARPAAAAPHLAELPPGDAGIVAAIGPWQQHAGRKHALCGAIGGAMRKNLYSADECAAVIRDWLPPGDPTVDVDAGVAWALGAWDHDPDAVSGVAALAELVGAEHAARLNGTIEASSFMGRIVSDWTAKRPPPAPAHGAWAHVPAVAGWAEPPRLLQATPDEPIEYYCDGLRIAPSDGKITLVAGLPGAGKGPIVDHLAVCFALGRPAFGKFACRKSNVLLLDAEGGRLTKRRTARMTRALGLDPRVVLDECLDIRNVSQADLLSQPFHDWLRAHPADVIVLDSYTSAMLATGLDTFKPEFAVLAKLLGALERVVIAVAHANKAPARNERPTLEQVAGSGALAAMAATGIATWHPDDDDADLVRVACMRAPEKGFTLFDARFEDTDGDGLSVLAVDEQKERRNAGEADREALAVTCDRVLAYLRKSGGWKTKGAIADDLACHHSTVARALDALERAGFVVLQPSPRPNAKAEFAIRGDAPEHVAISEAGAVTAAQATAGVGPFVRGRA